MQLLPFPDGSARPGAREFQRTGTLAQKERGQAIDAAGQLITGESFHDVRDLKRILKDRHRLDFYRCLTEKMLTYALGAASSRVMSRLSTRSWSDWTARRDDSPPC